MCSFKMLSYSPVSEIKVLCQKCHVVFSVTQQMDFVIMVNYYGNHVCIFRLNVIGGMVVWPKNPEFILVHELKQAKKTRTQKAYFLSVISLNPNLPNNMQKYIQL